MKYALTSCLIVVGTIGSLYGMGSPVSYSEKKNDDKHARIVKIIRAARKKPLVEKGCEDLGEKTCSGSSSSSHNEVNALKGRSENLDALIALVQSGTCPCEKAAATVPFACNQLNHRACEKCHDEWIRDREICPFCVVAQKENMEKAAAHECPLCMVREANTAFSCNNPAHNACKNCHDQWVAQDQDCPYCGNN